MYNLKKLTNALGCMNVILLHSKHQHDSATHFIHKMIPLLWSINIALQYL